MAIRDEQTSTDEILRDSRFHRAALAADPRTTPIASLLATAETKLRQAATHRQERENQRTDALAVLLRTDFELDERLRPLELAVLGAVGKNRAEPLYRAIFPKGLSAPRARSAPGRRISARTSTMQGARPSWSWAARPWEPLPG